MLSLIVAMFLSSCLSSRAAEIQTNSVIVHNAPKWLTATRVNKIVDNVQRALEWDIRRVSVHWHLHDKDFENAHGLPARGSSSVILAVAKRNENAIHVGPKVDSSNFDGTFGHELAHVVMFQKYKDAIPKWLEEGLANWAAKKGSIDYKYLSGQPAVDVRTMVHPFNGAGPDPRYHYMASTALVQLLASRCRIHDLLQLSVGQKLESYLGTFCNITDLNAEFQKFVKRKANGS